MKKTLIALAAVAVSSAAMAQSTVTLSGTVDTGLQKQFSGAPLSMVASRNGTSQWTLVANEDLGGGLMANVKVSTSFNSDDGTTTGNVLGNNDMFVGLTGGFGQIKLGRPVHLLWMNALVANGTKGVTGYDSSTMLDGTANKRGGAASGVYSPNAVQYLSPSFGGVKVQLQYEPKEVADGTDGLGLGVTYAAGPLSLSLTNYKAGTAVVKQKAVTQIGAAYDLGVAKAFFTFRDQGGLASDADSSYALGVTVPMGTSTIYASYNVNEKVGADGRSLIAGYKYSLSKRTTAYVNVANGKNLAINSGKSSTGYGIGLQHNF